MIVKRGKKFLVMDSSGEKVLGTHDSKEKAEKQLTAIHISQHERNESTVVPFSSFIKEQFTTLEYHDELNPKLWNEYELKPEVREKLIQIGDYWTKWAGFPKNAIRDYIFVGGNANYNYTPKSDIDLHIIVDANEIADCPDIIDDYFENKRDLWKLKHNISIYGINVEISAQDIDDKFPENQGVFSLLKNEWLSKPTNLEMKLGDIPGSEEVNYYKSQLDTALGDTQDEDQIKKLKKIVKDLRVSSLMQSGEFGVGNLIFKELRNLGYFDKMNQLLKLKQDERLSL
jgi:hypothetical protein